MARKVTDVSNDVDSYLLLSQTPKNYDKNNFYLKELQDKVDAEWKYRFNRVDVDFEQTWGQNDYQTLEVVQQHVKNDKATAYTDDYRRLVFRNIREKRFNIGSKFRFMSDNSVPDLSDLEIDETGYNKKDPRDTWLVTNFSSIKASTSVIVTRCNGVLGSIFQDSQGVAHRHYEPIIQTIDLTATNLFYNETAVSPQSAFVGIVQHNQFTKQYNLNQRFIIGYDKVYRIKAIDKFYGRNTNNPEAVGLMKIYFEVTEASFYDDFDTLIAYQSRPQLQIAQEGTSTYSIHFVKPEDFPTDLTLDGIEFESYLYKDREILQQDIEVEYSLENLPNNVDPSRYITFEKTSNNTFVFVKKRMYPLGDLAIKVYVPAEKSPTGEEISASFKLAVRGVN